MAVAIRNLTSNPIHLRLNSGPYLRLSPGAVSESLPAVEVLNNDKVDKLVGQRAIAVEQQPEAAESRAEAAESRAKKASSK